MSRFSAFLWYSQRKTTLDLNIGPDPIPQIIDSIIDPSLDLETWFCDLVHQWRPVELGRDLQSHPQQEDEDDRGPIASMFLRNLIKIPSIVRQPASHLSQARSSYLLARTDLHTLSQRMSRISKALSTKLTTHISNPPLQLRLLIVYQTAYGILLAITILLNAILRAFDNFNPLIIAESSWLPEQVLTLAEQVSRYRPLGASYMPLPLMMAWAATLIPTQRKKLEVHLLDWQTDFYGADYVAGALWMERMLEAMRLGRARPTWESVG